MNKEIPALVQKPDCFMRNIQQSAPTNYTFKVQGTKDMQGRFIWPSPGSEMLPGREVVRAEH